MSIREKRPIIRVPRSKITWAFELIAILSGAWLIYATITSWSALPGSIPSHFDAAGNVNAWGGRGSVLILPIFTFFLFTLLSLLSGYPHLYNYPVKINEENAAKQYRYARDLMVCLKAEITASFTYMQGAILRIALGHGKAMGLWFLPVFLVLIFGTIIYYVRLTVKHK